METIALCEELEKKGNKSIFRIIYCVDKVPKPLLSTSVGQKPTLSMDYASSVMSSPSQSSTTSYYEFNSHSFETTPEVSHEIVQKINKILDLRSSSVRKKYLESKEKRKFWAKKPFF
jgi:SAPK-interacting protein 1 (Sin1), Pleckstrin-homology